jgi:hypothetical protein
METLGMNWGVLLVNVLIVGSWPIFSIIALLVLRRSHITGTSQALWALLVVAIPILGALAFFLVKPGEKDQS